MCRVMYTPDRERKRMIRLLLEDVTLVRGENITLHIRFKGGATKTLMVPAPLNAWQQRATNPAVVKEIDRLLDHHTPQQIASILNERGLRSGEGKSFSVRIVARIQKRYGLMPRYDRLRKAGMLTVKEMAELLASPHNGSRSGIAMDSYAVTPATTKTTACMNIQ